MAHNSSRNTQVNYSAPPRPLRNQDSSFTQQDLDFEDSPLFFPAGLEKLFLLIYFILLPYITGLLFLFFYVAKAKYEAFTSMNQDSSFLFTWVIGYEILAVMMLIYIIKLAVSFSMEEKSKEKRREAFRRP